MRVMFGHLECLTSGSCCVLLSRTLFVMPRGGPQACAERLGLPRVALLFLTRGAASAYAPLPTLMEQAESHERSRHLDLKTQVGSNTLHRWNKTISIVSESFLLISACSMTVFLGKCEGDLPHSALWAEWLGDAAGLVPLAALKVR